MLKRTLESQDKWRNLGKVRELLALHAVVPSQVNAIGT
jgi:hypothetical protein